MNLREYATEILERIKDAVVEIIEELTGEVINEKRLVKVPVRTHSFPAPVRTRNRRHSY